MPTDTERREVARRLRELSRCVFSPESTYELLADAFGVDDFEDTSDLFNRLADLIEPSCDRDALLALADEMDAEKNFVLVGGYARRIREALGVVE